MADRVVVCVGTKRGLFVLESDSKRGSWELRGPYLKGWEVNHATVDTRGTPRLCAAATSFSFGSTVMIGDLAGKKFDGAKKPPKPPKLPSKAQKFAEKYGIATTPRLWHVEPARANEKDVLYAGAAPAALFRSEDGGKSWDEVKSLTKHPSRKDWNPGAGGMCLHSIQCDPDDAKRMWVGISAAGVFRTDDGGKSWKPVNKATGKYVGAPKNGETGH
jgi:hypothetical protein